MNQLVSAAIGRSANFLVPRSFSGAAVLIICMMAVLFPVSSAAARTYAAIVLSYPSGEVLHEDNADAVIYPASLTKMMTLLLTFQAIDRGSLNLHQRLPVSEHATAQPPSKLGLKPGMTIRVEDAIRALATKSANDVAVILAEAIGGSEGGFAAQMNRMARQIGMTRTTFVNASGLPDDRQVTTARDLARLSQALLRDWPQYYKYFSQSGFRYGNKVLRNHNHLMERYEGMDGIKTGYIRASGFNLAASAVRGNRRLVAVVIGGKTARERDDRMEVLLDQAFARLGEGTQVAAATRSVPGVEPAAFVMPPRNPARISEPDDNEEAEDIAAPGALLAVIPVPKPSSGAESGSQDEVQQVAFAPPSVKPDPAVWGVQVGAFSNQRLSEQALKKANAVLGRNFRHLSRKVEPVAVKRGKVYRARFYGFVGERSANLACDLVRKHGQKCATVAPE